MSRESDRIPTQKASNDTGSNAIQICFYGADILAKSEKWQSSRRVVYLCRHRTPPPDLEFATRKYDISREKLVIELFRVNGGKPGYYIGELISSFKSDNPSQDEHALHEKFLDNRVHGEWFEIVDLNVNDFCPTLSFRTIKNLCVKYLRRLYLSTSVEDIDSRRILILTIVFCQKSKIRSEIETVYFFLDKIEQILSFANTEGFNCELYVKNQIKNVFPKLIKTHDYKS